MTNSENKVTEDQSNEAVAKLPKSDNNTIRLIKYEPQFFGGITPDTALVINFEEHEDKNMLAVEGDQGVCKTSFLNGLISLMGGELPPNAINSKEKKLQAELVFKKADNDKVSYIVKRTKTAITITRQEELPDGGFSRSIQQSPISFLQETFGIGISPMALKAMKGAAQIKWLRDQQRLTTEQKKQEQSLKTEAQEVYDKRTKKNAEVKDIVDGIVALPYYRLDKEDSVWKHTQKYIDDKSRIDGKVLDKLKVEEEYNQKGADKLKYDKAVTELENIKNDEKRVSDEVADLERRLLEKKAELERVQDRKKTGENWIADNNKIPVEFAVVQKTLLDLNELLTIKGNIETIDSLIEKYNTATDEQLVLNSELEEKREQLKSLIAEFTPKIDGLEVVVEDSIDNAKAEGIYYRGHTMAELSESELWQFFVQLCVELGIRFVFIENSQSLGSEAVSIINMLSKEKGVKVFFSTMMRGQSTISAVFYEKMV